MSALADLMALDDAVAPKLDPRVFVEAPDRRVAHEIVRQGEVLAHVRRHAKRVMVFAIPNSARSEREKLRQHREGVRTGASDLICLWDGGVAFVEMKDGKSMPRPNQVEFLNDVIARGHPAAVCRSVGGATRFLAGVGAPVGELR